jgi:hypothetical protein
MHADAFAATRRRPRIRKASGYTVASTWRLYLGFWLRPGRPAGGLNGALFRAHHLGSSH